MAQFKVKDHVDIMLGDGQVKRVMVARVTPNNPPLYECIDVHDQITRYFVSETRMRKVL